jgi:hypothetical protein
MERLHLTRPSAGLVVATAALVVAMAGTGYALSIPSNSVGTKQLRSNAVTSAKIKNGQVKAEDLASNSVTSSKIVDGSIMFGDARPGDFVAGPGSIVTISGDADTGLEAEVGSIAGFGSVTVGCAEGGGGEDTLTVNNGGAGSLTLSAVVSGTVVSATASAGADAVVTLLPSADAAYDVQVATGSSVATGTLWRSTTGTGCHFTLQGVSNVS